MNHDDDDAAATVAFAVVQGKARQGGGEGGSKGH